MGLFSGGPFRIVLPLRPWPVRVEAPRFSVVNTRLPIQGGFSPGSTPLLAIVLAFMPSLLRVLRGESSFSHNGKPRYFRNLAPRFSLRVPSRWALP